MNLWNHLVHCCWCITIQKWYLWSSSVPLSWISSPFLAHSLKLTYLTLLHSSALMSRKPKTLFWSLFNWLISPLHCHKNHDSNLGCLSNFLQKQGAQLVVLEGKRSEVWENTWSTSCLDLHLMSSGAACAMVHAWLLSIRSIVFEGHELPKMLRYFL